MEDPQFITYLRIGYVSSQVIALGIYYLITVFVSMHDTTYKAETHGSRFEERTT